MSKPDMGSTIHIKNKWNILVIGNYYVNYQNYQNLMRLTSSDTKRTLMHLLLFTNSAQTELVSICTQSIHNRNWLSLHYILGMEYVFKVNIAFGKTIIATNEVRPIKVKNRKTTFKSFYMYLMLLKANSFTRSLHINFLWNLGLCTLHNCFMFI